MPEPPVAPGNADADRSADLPGRVLDLPGRAPVESLRPLLWNRRFAVVLLGFGLLFFFNAWERDFWAPEEADFAAATLEMARDPGGWLVPTLAGRPYFEKPPLLYWSGLLFQKALFLDPHAAYRLPPALFGVLGLWVTYAFGVLFFHRSIASVALFVQATTVLYYRCASWYITDMPFAAAISLSMLAFTVLLLERSRDRKWKWAAYGGLALGCLLKSPLLGPYLVVMPLLVFLFVRGRLKGMLAEIRRLRPLPGLLAVLAVVAPWYLWMTFRYGSSFVQDAFLEHHVQRLHAAESHRQSAWYYVLTLPVDFLPWTLFLPAAIFHAHVHLRRVQAKLMLIWVLVPFVTLTLISSKQGKYLLPIWTPLSILVAAALLETYRESLWEDFLGKGVLRAVPWILRGLAAGLVVAALIVAVGLLPGRLHEPPFAALVEDSGFRTRIMILALVAAASLLLAARRASWSVFQGDAASAARAMALGFAGVALAFSFAYGPLDRVKSGRGFCEEVARIAGERPVAIYGTPRAAILCYLDRPLARVFDALDPIGDTPGEQKALEEYLQASDERFLLAYEKDLAKLEGDFPRYQAMYREVGSGMVGSRRRYVILSNRDSAE